MTERDLTTWHRLSPRMLLIHPVTIAFRALPQLLAFTFVGRAIGDNRWPFAVAGILGALGITRWFTTRLRITSENVQLKTGLVTRKTKTTARDRIRSVDVTAQPMHRLLGLNKLVIGTGSNDGDGRLELDGLTHKDAESLRDELLHRRAVQVDEPEIDELARLDNRWIRYAPFTLSGLATGLVTLGFVFQLNHELRINAEDWASVRRFFEALADLPVWLLVTSSVVATLAFFVGVAMLSYVLAYWRFRLLRHDHGTLQVTRGLLTTRATSVERRRLVGATVTDSAGMRYVDAAAVTGIATGLGSGGSSGGSSILLPPAPRATALDVAAEVLDGSPVFTAALEAHPRQALRRRVVRAAFWGSLPVIAAVVIWWQDGPWPLVPIGALLLVASLAVGVDSYRNLGHALADGYLVTRRGSINRKQAAISTEALIGWKVQANWFQRRLGLVTLVATTAAGSQGYSVLDVSPDQGLAVMREVSPHLVDQFAT
jgi:putative membrane protein